MSFENHEKRKWQVDLAQGSSSAGELALHVCRFSWFCNRKCDVPEQKRCWEHLSIVLRGQTDGDVYVTAGCLFCELDGVPKREPDEVTRC